MSRSSSTIWHNNLQNGEAFAKTGAQIELISSMLEWALCALPSTPSAVIIQNDEAFAKIRARIELISSMLKSALWAQPPDSAAIQNDESFS